jgi:hypothetical protein
MRKFFCILLHGFFLLDILFLFYIGTILINNYEHFNHSSSKPRNDSLSFRNELFHTAYRFQRQVMLERELGTRFIPFDHLRNPFYIAPIEGPIFFRRKSR